MERKKKAPTWLWVVVLGSICFTVFSTVKGLKKETPLQVRTQEQVKKKLAEKARTRAATLDSFNFGDPVESFEHYAIRDLTEDLSHVYVTKERALLAFSSQNIAILRQANKSGVTAAERYRNSLSGETFYEFAMTGLPGDSVKSQSFKIQFVSIDSGVKLGKIGERFQCYRSENPDEWTTEFCP